MDGIEKKVEGQAQVVRFNIQNPLGKQIAERYKARLVPTFVVFNKSGKETWRASGQIAHRQNILKALADTRNP